LANLLSLEGNADSCPGGKGLHRVGTYSPAIDQQLIFLAVMGLSDLLDIVLPFLSLEVILQDCEPISRRVASAPGGLVKEWGFLAVHWYPLGEMLDKRVGCLYMRGGGKWDPAAMISTPWLSQTVEDRGVEGEGE
jgi:hypothetical protein